MAKKRRDLQETLMRFKDALADNIRVHSLILFGSYAAGKQKKYSDIDVAVVSPDFSRTNAIRNLQLLFNIAKKVDIDIEPLAFLPEEIKNPDPRSFESEIIRTGKIIYKK